MALDVTLFPQPDSPTMANVSLFFLNEDEHHELLLLSHHMLKMLHEDLPPVEYCLYPLLHLLS